VAIAAKEEKLEFEGEVNRVAARRHSGGPGPGALQFGDRLDAFWVGVIPPGRDDGEAVPSTASEAQKRLDLAFWRTCQKVVSGTCPGGRSGVVWGAQTRPLLESARFAARTHFALPTRAPCGLPVLSPDVAVRKTALWLANIDVLSRRPHRDAASVWGAQTSSTVGICSVCSENAFANPTGLGGRSLGVRTCPCPRPAVS
jgi:hypothetical protein